MDTPNSPNRPDMQTSFHERIEIKHITNDLKARLDKDGYLSLPIENFGTCGVAIETTIESGKIAEGSLEGKQVIIVTHSHIGTLYPAGKGIDDLLKRNNQIIYELIKLYPDAYITLVPDLDDLHASIFGMLQLMIVFSRRAHDINDTSAKLIQSLNKAQNKTDRNSGYKLCVAIMPGHISAILHKLRLTKSDPKAEEFGKEIKDLNIQLDNIKAMPNVVLFNNRRAAQASLNTIKRQGQVAEK